MYLELISCSLADPVEISCSQIRSGKCVVSCVLSGCVEVCIVVCWMHHSLGVFLWGVLRHSLCSSPWGQGGWGGGGKEYSLYFLVLCDCAFTVPQSEGA